IVPIRDAGVPTERESEFYYRPRRNMIDRLQAIGGRGMLFQGLHQNTIPQLFHRVLKRKQELGLTFEPLDDSRHSEPAGRKLYPVSQRKSKLAAEDVRALDTLHDAAWSQAADPSFR